MVDKTCIEALAVKSVEIEKRHAHDLVNAQTERRRHIRDAIDEIAGQIIETSPDTDALVTN